MGIGWRIRTVRSRKGGRHGGPRRGDGVGVGGISKDLFHLQVPWEEKVIRAVVVYTFLLLALRLFGRRELGQFTAFDLVVLLTLSNILQNAMIGNDSIARRQVRRSWL